MRAIGNAVAISLVLAITILPVNAKETVKDLAAKASAELRLLTAFQTLERMTGQMNHFLIYVIEAERGGWRVIAKDVSNHYVLIGTAEDLLTEIGRASSSIRKSKVATEDELKSAETVVEQLRILIDLAPMVSGLISTGAFDEAAVLYKEEGHAAYESAIRNAQSGVITSQKRLGKTLLDIRIAK